MMICKRCGGNESHKNGMMNGKQRYRCKSCGFNYTTGFRGKPVELRQKALKLYTEGLGYRAIGRLLDVSNVTVLNWVRAYGLSAKPKQDNQDTGGDTAKELNDLSPVWERPAAVVAAEIKYKGQEGTPQ